MNDLSSSHKQLITKFLDKGLLRRRLNRYSYIKKYFENAIDACNNKAPYYCHYMGWRLGTWTSERPFEVLDELLCVSSTFPNWSNSNKKGQFSSCEFGDYWSLLWELQMACFFSKVGGLVSWLPSGPDFRVTYEGHEFFVECTTLRKSFELELFMGEIFRKIGTDIYIDHIWFIPFTLPKGKGAKNFLNEVFHHYLDDKYLLKKREEAKTQYPVLLPVPAGTTNLSIYLRGDDSNSYMPGIVPNAAGDPDIYVSTMVKEVINNKRTSNSLKNSRPNILAINFLLSAEFQMANDRQAYLGASMPPINFGDFLDAVLYSSCGITDEVRCPKVFTRDYTHIVRRFPQGLFEIAG